MQPGCFYRSTHAAVAVHMCSRPNSFRGSLRSDVARWWRQDPAPSPVWKNADRKGVNFHRSRCHSFCYLRFCRSKTFCGHTQTTGLLWPHNTYLSVKTKRRRAPRAVSRPRENVFTSCAAETWRHIPVINTDNFKQVSEKKELNLASRAVFVDVTATIWRWTYWHSQHISLSLWKIAVSSNLCSFTGKW